MNPKQKQKQKRQQRPSFGRVMALYPTDGTVSAHWHRSMVELERSDRAYDLGIYETEANGISGANISRARNKLVRTFLESDCEWSWWIDSDMVFAADVLARLLLAGRAAGDAKVIGALACVVNAEDGPQPTLFADNELSGAGIHMMLDWPEGVILEVAATGTGCLLVHRQVYLDIEAAEPGPFPWFHETVLDGDWVGEDTNFCLKARAAGHRVVVDTSTPVGHHKGHRVYWPHESRSVEFHPIVAVVPVKDHLDLTQDIVAQLRSQAAHIVIVDNGSTDGTAEWLEAQRDLEVLTMVGAGIHEMWNAGIERALKFNRVCTVALLNNDLRLGPDALARTAAAMRTEVNCVVACPNYDGRTIEGPVQDVAEICADRYDGTGGLAGFAMVVRGEWFRNGYRFPEECTWWYGDNDLLLSVLNSGGRCSIVRDATVEHLDGGSQTGTWTDPKLQAVLDADRDAFLAKWSA